MNALFIGPYRQNDEWGLASRRYIKAIATAVPNISIRPIYLSSNILPELDDEFIKYEHTHYDHYDIVYQKALPHCFVPQTMTKRNVGIFAWHTNNISRSNSIYTLNHMSEICVSSNQEARSLKLSGVTAPIRIISQPLDVADIRLSQEAPASTAFGFDPMIERSFKFYTIVDYVQSHNLLDIVLAFNLAFRDIDNVSLIIHAQKPGLSSTECHKKISEDIQHLKQKMNIGPRPKKEVLITQNLPDNGLMLMHKACDCYVSTPLGSSFCRRTAEALCLGKTPIVTDHTGMTDYINNENGFLIKSQKTPVLVSEKTLSNEFDIYNANEYWYQPNIYSLIEHMQNVYTMYRKNKDKLIQKRQLGINMLDTFSYENIGKKICN